MSTTTDESEPDVQRRFVSIKGERVDNGEYLIHGLPFDADFREPGMWDTVKCGALKVNDVGFSANAFEFGEHKTAIVVTQTNAAGLTNITFEELEES